MSDVVSTGNVRAYELVPDGSSIELKVSVQLAESAD
jgi:hypothetical protein